MNFPWPCLMSVQVLGDQILARPIFGFWKHPEALDLKKKNDSRYSTWDRIVQAQRHSVQAWQIFFTFYLPLAAYWAELPCDRQDKLLVTARIVIIFRILGAQKICESYFNTPSTPDRKYSILAGHSTQNWLLFGYLLCDRIALIVISKYPTRDRLDLWRQHLNSPKLGPAQRSAPACWSCCWNY